MCFHRCSLPAGFQDAWLLQQMTNTFCSPSYACLEFPPRSPCHPHRGLLSPFPFPHILLFLLLAWLVARSYFSGREKASSPDIKPDPSPSQAMSLCRWLCLVPSHSGLGQQGGSRWYWLAQGTSHFPGDEGHSGHIL